MEVATSSSQRDLDMLAGMVTTALRLEGEVVPRGGNATFYI